MNRYSIIIIKQDIQVKLTICKVDCIRLGHGHMRLVHRRSNPNKETLIYIPLSHATEIQAYRIRVANRMKVKTGIHNNNNQKSIT